MSKKPSSANQYQLKISASEREASAETAKVYSSPSFHAGLLQLELHPDSGLELMSSVADMQKQCENYHNGDIKRIEAMLLGQAHSLQAIFTRHTQRMVKAEYLPQLKMHAAIALKAQNQCRQTLTALAEIKNPKRATFIKNQATNQQINLHQPDSSQNNFYAKPSNELLSEGHHATLDSTGTATASAANHAMATVENCGS